MVLKNYVVEDLNKDPDNYNTMVLAQDFGFTHANVILTVAFKEDNIYILNELYVYELDTTQIIALAEGAEISKKLPMYCDSAEPDRIVMWKRAGYKAMPVKKGPGSVAAQIDYLKQNKIHIDASCTNTIREIGNWRWQKDNKTGEYIDVPVQIEDDAMATLRYAVEPLRRQKKFKTMSKSALGL